MRKSKLVLPLVLCQMGSLLVGCGQAPVAKADASKFSPKQESATAQETASTQESASTEIEVEVAKPATAKKNTSFLDEYSEIERECIKQYVTRIKSIEDEFRPSMTQEQQMELVGRMNKAAVEYQAYIAPLAKKAFEIVEPHAADPAVAEPLLSVVKWEYNGEVGAKAAALLAKHHAVDPSVVQFTQEFVDSGFPWVETLLRAQLTADDLPDEQRPMVHFGLTKYLQAMNDLNPGTVDIDELKSLLKELETKYGNYAFGDGPMFADLARMGMFRLEKLAVGNSVPDILGEDIEGVPFKLSDYRGKVVMLSFWASWCGPCMALIPHEREIVKKFESRPFALIGVNGDVEKRSLQALMDRENITWRSFWSGTKGPGGDIPQKWTVQTWPTIYLIDHTGKIRVARQTKVDDATIEKLVMEAESDNSVVR